MANENLEGKTKEEISFVKKVSRKLLPWAVGASGPLLLLLTGLLISNYEKKYPILCEHPPEVRAYIGAKESGNEKRANFCLKNFYNVQKYMSDIEGAELFVTPLLVIYATFSGAIGAGIYIDGKERERKIKYGIKR
ncbi:MAG: hypothetical protein Q8N88_03935 [Nanoarchaeota archaeon]|nr:hypothetical protein [Nanoarchaeota archaeon]